MHPLAAVGGIGCTATVRMKTTIGSIRHNVRIGCGAKPDLKGKGEFASIGLLRR
jgi:hypothetical protein